MKAVIMFRNNWKCIGGDGWTYYPMTVEISDKCLKCGGLRGKPYPYRFCEDGQWFTVDRWDNPCGHIDLYPEMYLESKKIAEMKGK